MTLTLQRCVYTGALMVWGMMLTVFCVSGRISSYLHPAFQPWALVAGVLLILMAVGVMFLPGGEHEFCAEECGETHMARSKGGLILMGLILIVPPIVAATFSPSQFGATAVRNRGYVEDVSTLPGYQPYTEPVLPGESAASVAQTTATVPTDYMPRNEKGQITAEPVDLLYAAEDPAMRKDFENKEVAMVGQFMPSKANNAAGNRFSLVKMFIVCCASDARPVAISIETPAPPAKVAEMSWVKVVGKATFPVEGGRRIPVIVATSVEPCDPPQESFIYN